MDRHQEDHVALKNQEKGVQGGIEGGIQGSGRVDIQGLNLDGDREEKKGVVHPTLHQPLDYLAKDPLPQPLAFFKIQHTKYHKFDQQIYRNVTHLVNINNNFFKKFDQK